MTDILKRAGMSECKPLATPISTAKVSTSVFNADPYDDLTQFRSLAGALQYLTVTRPNLSFTVNQLCQNMHAPAISQLEQLKRGAACLFDSDWAGCPDDWKSTSGYVVFLGTNLISWVCKKQRTVARSSTEAEYKALADVCAEVTWIISLLREINISDVPVPSCGVTTLHVEIDYHFVRDKVATGAIQVNFISPKDQLADVFTKALPGPRFSFLETSYRFPVYPELEGEY
ncbi:uncharacterized protein LOC116033256 [Ipomoea triloba]|uniref:uncharacterized protein LOC116033256 n=1 Tax=Ipomoea triloba TaxID=35885 RepID=UPI00125DE9D3|nr:uncharacterized protein LOC116033256 [Ipomoea triloba]